MGEAKFFADQLAWKSWVFYFIATEKGLAYVDVEKPKAFDACLKDERIMTPYIEAFQSYFNGERTSLDIPLDVVVGTSFQRRVWEALLTIPFGESRSYGDIAKQIGNPKAIRAVGGAIGKNPILIAVPCHRVIGKNKRLTGFSSGLDLKAQLLELEKIKYK